MHKQIHGQNEYTNKMDAQSERMHNNPGRVKISLCPYSHKYFNICHIQGVRQSRVPKPRLGPEAFVKQCVIPSTITGLRSPDRDKRQLPQSVLAVVLLQQRAEHRFKKRIPRWPMMDGLGKFSIKVSQSTLCYER